MPATTSIPVGAADMSIIIAFFLINVERLKGGVPPLAALVIIVSMAAWFSAMKGRSVGTGLMPLTAFEGT